MVGWYYLFNGQGFEKTLGVGFGHEGQNVAVHGMLKTQI